MKIVNGVLIILSVLGVIFAGILKVLEEKWNLSIFLFHMSSQGIISLAVMISAICLAAFLARIILRLRKEGRIAAVLQWFLLAAGGFILLAVLLMFSWIGFITEPRYYVYHSPDHEKTIVIEEEAFLLTGYGSVYVKENALFMKNVQGYTTDDGYRPFRNEDYELGWGSDYVRIIFGYGSMGIQKELTIQLRD